MDDLIGEAVSQLQPGDHLCSLYTNKEEQLSCLVPFLQAGLSRQEKCLYIADDNSIPEIREALTAQGIEVAQHTASEQLVFTTKEETYARGGSFDPQKMLSFFPESFARALSQGFAGLWAAAEMTWVFSTPQGVEKLAQYEAFLNQLSVPLTLLCQYNVSLFPPGLLSQILSTHPLIFYQGVFHPNHRYLSPREREKPEADLTRQLADLVQRKEERLRWRKQIEELQEELSFKSTELHQRVVGNLTIDLVSTTLMADADMHQLLETCVAQVCHTMDVDEARIWLVQDNSLKLAVSYGGSPGLTPHQETARGECLCGMAAEQGIAIHSANLAQDPRATRNDCREDGFSCRLCLPLRWGGRITGVLSVARRSQRPFSSSEQELFTSLSYQVSIALENMRLHHKEQEKARQLEKILDLSRVISSGPDIQEIYDHFIRLLQESVEVDWSTIAFVEGDNLQIVALSGELAPPWKLGIDTPVAGTAIEWAIQQRQPLVNNDLSQHRDFWTDKVMFKHGTRSSLRYPLFYRGTVFGVLSLGSRRPGAYGASQVEFVGQLLGYTSSAIYNAWLLQDTQEKSWRLEALSRLTHTITSSLELDQVYQAFAEEMMKWVDFDIIYINAVLGDKIRIEKVYPPQGEETPLREGAVIAFAGSATEQLVQTRQTQIIPDFAKEKKFWSDEVHLREGMRSGIHVPLFARGEVIGTLVLIRSHPGAYGKREQQFLEELAGQLGLALNNSLLYRQTLELSSKDSLTRLFHQRSFYQHLEREVLRAQRYNHPLSIMLIDLDNFKEVNETYGHQAGDEVLREFSSVLQKESRGTDIVARYGGDEFGIILPETSKEAAGMLAERLAKTVREKTFSSGKVKLTLSLGISSCPQDESTATQLVESADKALFQVKQAGGDAFRYARGAESPKSKSESENKSQ